MDHHDLQITVRPVAGGWCVQCDVTGELMFLSGARAEEKARSLAACLASLGDDVELAVHDLQGGLIATRRYCSELPLAIAMPQSLERAAIHA